MEPFIGQISLMAFDYAPEGWTLCDGKLITISEYTALYSLLGTRYGGDGRSTFGVPDLQGRVPVHPGYNIIDATEFGAEIIKLTDSNLPAHTHYLEGSIDPATNDVGTNKVLGAYVKRGTKKALAYVEKQDANIVQMHEKSIGMAGDGSYHTNMQPFLTLSFCIALDGYYPPRS